MSKSINKHATNTKILNYNINVLKGTLWVLLYVCLSVINDVFTFNGANRLGLHSSQIVCSRFFFSTISLLPILFFLKPKTSIYKYNILNNLYTTNILQHILRAFVLGAGLFTYIYTYKATNISMSINVISSSLTPIFSSIFAYFFFKDKLSKQLPIFALSIAGTIIALSSHFTISSIYAARFMLISSICYALTDIVNKLSINSKESSVIIMFYTNLFIIILFFPFALIYWQVIDLRQLCIFMISGINGSIISFCLIKSLRYTNVSTLQPLKYLKLPLVFLCDKNIFHTIIGNQLWLGFILILLSSILSTYRQSRDHTNTPSSSN